MAHCQKDYCKCQNGRATATKSLTLVERDLLSEWPEFCLVMTKKPQDEAIMSKPQDRSVYRRRDGKWANKRNDAKRATSLHRTQRDAQVEAKRAFAEATRW